MVIHISCAFNGMSYFVKRGGGAASSAFAGTQVSPVYQRIKCLRSFRTKMISNCLVFFPRDDFFVSNNFGVTCHLAGAVADWNFEETRCVLEVVPLSMVFETLIKGFSSSYHINRVPLGSVICLEEKLYKAAAWHLDSKDTK